MPHDKRAPSLSRQQVKDRLLGAGLAGALLLGVVVAVATASGDPNGFVLFTLLAAVAGFAIGFQVGRMLWRKDRERLGIDGFSLGDWTQR